METPTPSAACTPAASRAAHAKPPREHHIVVRQVDDDSVEAVRDSRAGWAAGFVLGPEHEVVDQELRASSEEVRQRGAPYVGLEAILLVDPNPRHLLPPPRQ